MFSTALSRLEHKYKKRKKKETMLKMLKLDNERIKLAAFITLFVLPDSKNWQID